MIAMYGLIHNSEYLDAAIISMRQKRQLGFRSRRTSSSRPQLGQQNLMLLALETSKAVEVHRDRSVTQKPGLPRFEFLADGQPGMYGPPFCRKRKVMSRVGL